MTDRAYIPWIVLGAGRFGSAIAQLGLELGVTVRLVWNRSDFNAPNPKIKKSVGELETIFDHVGGCIVWICVADDAIEEVAGAIAPYLRPADIVVHGSGSLDSQVLRRAGVNGPVASIHPLLSIGEARRATQAFSECAWTIEGDFPALSFARWMLGQIGVEPIEIEASQKVLYHTAAVMSAGLLDALMDAVFAVAEEAGFTSEQARAMFLPLAGSILKNLEEKDTAQALTGPVARGDEEVLRRHLRALEKLDDPELLAVYRVLTDRSKSLLESPH